MKFFLRFGPIKTRVVASKRPGDYATDAYNSDKKSERKNGEKFFYLRIFIRIFWILNGIDDNSGNAGAWTDSSSNSRARIHSGSNSNCYSKYNSIEFWTESTTIPETLEPESIPGQILELEFIPGPILILIRFPGQKYFEFQLNRFRA